jgi:adenine-specific DNA-methyltransferase
MARLEDLLDRIADASLRREFADALKRLKSRQRFGLVFEEHIPELVALPGLRIGKGNLVRVRAENDSRIYVIRSIEDGVATLTSVDGSIDREDPVENLNVVKRFGDPVYPALTPLGAVARAPERPFHAVVNGENYHSLQLLTYLYQGQVDCIYIDPPYNTGAKDWKYNNKYVDDNDTFRHSKWLAFMQRRLKLAKKLLKDDGVLICTVDEHEVHHLGMLLETIFRRHLRYTVTIVHNPKGTYKTNFARVDEYALFCCPNSERDVISALPDGLFAHATEPHQVAAGDPAGFEDLYLRRRGQESGHRHQRPNQFYAILVDEEERKVVGLGPALAADETYEVKKDGTIVTVYPLDTRNDERVWRYNRETMQALIDRGEIIVSGFSKRTGQGWVLNHRRPKRQTKRLKTVWWERRHDAGAHGSDLLTAYLGEAGLFPFPKSVYAVRDCLDAVVRDRPDALIVDFFAGSGTTLHATCLLNIEDGGRRRCVLVTNNEVDDATARRLTKAGAFPGDAEYESQGIFERIARPRIEATLTGIRPDGKPVEGEHTWAERRPYSEGFPENVEFYKLDYLDPVEIDLGWQFEAILPALWLASGAIGQRPVGVDTSSMLIPESSTFAVLFDDAQSQEFAERLVKRPDITHVYIVTDSPEAFAEVKGTFGSGRKVSMLYRDYLKNFEINTRKLAWT